MVDYAKKNPGKLNYGSAGLGTSTHMRIEMLKYKAGIDIVHVPYRGSADALNDLLPGNVQMMNEINVLPHVKAGKLILLNINYHDPFAGFSGYADIDRGWAAKCRRADLVLDPGAGGTPKDIVEKFNAKIVEIAAADDMKKHMREISVNVPSQTPAEMAAFLKTDFAANAEVIKAANVKLE